MTPRFTTMDYIRNPFRLVARLRHIAHNREPLSLNFFQNNIASKALMIYNNRRAPIRNISVVLNDIDSNKYTTSVPVIFGMESIMILFSDFTNSQGQPFNGGNLYQIKVDFAGHKVTYNINGSKIQKKSKS